MVARTILNIKEHGRSMTTERRVMISLPASSTTYVDLGLLYSAANHRMVRQSGIFKGKFHIDGETAIGLGGDEQFVIETLPMSWPVFGAYKHGRGMFDRAMSPEGEIAKKARWHDYRLYYDTAHKTQDAAGTKVVPTGCSLDFTAATGNADYVYSEVLDDNGTNTYTFHMLGPSDMAGTDRSFGMLAEYDAKDDTSIDETGATSTNYNSILNDVNSANETNLKEDGDRPPYNKDNLQLPTKQYNLFVFGGNGSNQPTASVPEAGVAVRSTGEIEVPFGVVKITNNIAASRTLLFTFSKGSHKGIAWEAV